MKASEIVAAVDRLVADLGTIRQALDSQLTDLSERAQAQSVIAFHLGTIRQGVIEVEADTVRLQAGAAALDGNGAAPAAPKAAPAARKRSRKKR